MKKYTRVDFGSPKSGKSATSSQDDFQTHHFLLVLGTLIFSFVVYFEGSPKNTLFRLSSNIFVGTIHFVFLIRAILAKGSDKADIIASVVIFVCALILKL
jgi:hypothetical protein